MAKLEYKIIPMAQFHIPEGMYTIEQLETMLDVFKRAKKRQDEHLEASIGSMKRPPNYGSDK